MNVLLTNFNLINVSIIYMYMYVLFIGDESEESIREAIGIIEHQTCIVFQEIYMCNLSHETKWEKMIVFSSEGVRYAHRRKFPLLFTHLQQY